MAIERICDGDVELMILRIVSSMRHAIRVAHVEPVNSFTSDQVKELIATLEMIGKRSVNTVHDSAPLISVVMPDHAKENQ